MGWEVGGGCGVGGLLRGLSIESVTISTLCDCSQLYPCHLSLHPGLNWKIEDYISARFWQQLISWFT